MKALLPMTAAIPAALMLFSCSSTPSAIRMNSSLLSRAPKEVKAPVNIARSELAVAQDAHKNAVKQAANAAEATELARQELNVVMAKVDQTRVEAETAKRTATPEEASAAQAAHEKVVETAAIARLGLVLSKREGDVALLREWLAREELNLAAANLELATGRAIDGLDLPAADAVSLVDLHSEVSFRAAEVQAMLKRLSAARVEMEKARGAHGDAVAKAR